MRHSTIYLSIVWSYSRVFQNLGNKPSHEKFLISLSNLLIHCIVLYCIVLYWWGGHCCPMHCDLSKIYWAPPNLDNRMWICRLNFAQRPIFEAWGSLTSLKSQTRESQLKVPPGGLVLRIFMSWKTPLTSAEFEPTDLGSRGEQVIPRPPRPTSPGGSAWN